MTKKEEFSYQDAITEIETILEKMENEELDVDVLSFQIKRVSQLIKLCREKLHKTEQEVEKILDEMEKEEE
ncbi:MAG: exodeoxyribonuclease VII small subunit [Bacteroidales bacterium]|nr:exodeoxyribonuclease VII small subunit [Bacteroidales bacterium]